MLILKRRDNQRCGRVGSFGGAFFKIGGFGYELL